MNRLRAWFWLRVVLPIVKLAATALLRFADFCELLARKHDGRK